VRTALAQIERNAPHACVLPDPEYLHQLRVGLRRLRAILRAFDGVLPEEALGSITDSYRRLRAALGRARDWDAVSHWLESMSAAQYLCRANAHERARRAIASPAFSRLIECARALTPQEGRVDVLARRAARDARRRVLRHASRMSWNRAADLHELRIRLRRERYICEAFAAHLDLRSFLPRVKALQDTLGELNDLRVARRLLAGNRLVQAQLSARRAALLGTLPGQWTAYLATGTLPRRASAAEGAGVRARAQRGRRRPRTAAARPDAGAPAPAR
jgi:CHAD domain-containing protein